MTTDNKDKATARRKLAYDLFTQEFGVPKNNEHVVTVHAPGRSEIAGNHTDHEGGHVIAGALNVSVDGIAAPNGTDHIRMASEGYPNI